MRAAQSHQHVMPRSASGRVQLAALAVPAAWGSSPQPLHVAYAPAGSVRTARGAEVICRIAFYILAGSRDFHRWFFLTLSKDFFVRPSLYFLAVGRASWQTHDPEANVAGPMPAERSRFEHVGKEEEESASEVMSRLNVAEPWLQMEKGLRQFSETCSQKVVGLRPATGFDKLSPRPSVLLPGWDRKRH